MGILDSIIGTNTSAGATQGAQIGIAALMGGQAGGNATLKNTRAKPTTRRPRTPTPASAR